MISLYQKDAADGTTKRYCDLDTYIVAPRVNRELMGAYRLTFRYPTNGPHAQDITLDLLIKAPVDIAGKTQFFRITSIDYTGTDFMEVCCDHVFFDLKYQVIPDKALINLSAVAAVRSVLSTSKRGFQVEGTPGPVASSRIVRQAIANYLLDPKLANGFIQRYGMELDRDNWKITIKQRLGSDQGVRFETGKNITSISQTLDMANVITRILPVGFDGLTLPELYVTSERAGEYAFVRTAVMRFDGVKAIKEADANPPQDALPLPQALEALRAAAKAQFAQGLDTPKASWDIDVVSLKRDPIYHERGYSAITELALGDTVHVKAPELGLEVSSRLVAYEFDPLLSDYVKLTIGTTTGSLTISSSSTGSAISSRLDGLESSFLILDAGVRDGSIGSADGKHTNHYGPVEPKNAAVGDVWFKDNGEHTEIWIYKQDATGKRAWIPVASHLIDGTVGEELDQAKKDVAEALKKAREIETELGGYVAKTEVVKDLNASHETDKITPGKLHLGASSQIDSSTLKESHLVTGAVSTRVLRDLAVTDAKIASLSASKITTGYLAAGRIAAGSITSDKLTIANGYIKNAMIADAAITSAKIANLDAAKITTGTLAASRIGARSITADKFATNALQVGLAGWTNSIRITPTQISWYDGTRLNGRINSSGVHFYYGNDYLGWMGQAGFKNKPDTFRGLNTHLTEKASYAAWTTGADTDHHHVVFTLDPKGKIYPNQPGIHLGFDLHTHGYALTSSGNRKVIIGDTKIGNRGTFSSVKGTSSLSQVVFQTHDLYVVTNGSYYNMTRQFERIQALIDRVNALIRYLNNGWIVSIQDRGNGSISWTQYDNTGLSQININTT